MDPWYSTIQFGLNPVFRDWQSTLQVNTREEFIDSAHYFRMLNPERGTQAKAMAGEAPGQNWLQIESSWVSNVREVDLSLGQSRIGIPEACIATKVWKTGIDTNASARSDHQCISIGN
jgi:hypothetical protein